MGRVLGIEERTFTQENRVGIFLIVRERRKKNKSREKTKREKLFLSFFFIYYFWGTLIHSVCIIPVHQNISPYLGIYLLEIALEDRGVTDRARYSTKTQTWSG